MDSVSMQVVKHKTQTSLKQWSQLNYGKRIFPGDCLQKKYPRVTFCSVSKRSNPWTIKAAQPKWRMRPQLKQTGMNGLRHTTPGLEWQTACSCYGCGNVLWKMEIKDIKQRFFMAYQLFYSKGHFNCNESFE